MTTEEVKRDFESARIKHIHFKSRLRSYLFGAGGEEGPLRDPEKCSMGEWIATRLRGKGEYAHLPEAREFDSQHIRVHLEANHLMDMYQAGQVEEALSAFRIMQGMNDKMVELLQTMEARMRTQA